MTTDFSAMVGGAMKDRLSRHVDAVVDVDREIETLKAQRKELLAEAEETDKLNSRAISAVAKLHRTGKTSASAEVWPYVEAYAGELGMILPGATTA